MIEPVLLDLALRRRAGVTERPTRSARLTAPLFRRVGGRYRAFSRDRGREGRLRAVTEQVDVFPLLCRCLVSSSLSALPTSHQQRLMVMGAYRRRT